jgi:putative Mn2+ efflux pump MntP
MIDIVYRAVALAFDGFIVSLGVGAMLPARKRVAMSLAFGAFDSAAYAGGALLGALCPWVFTLGWLGPIRGLVLAGYGALVIFLASRRQMSWFVRSGWVLLPALLSLDNLMAGACLPQGSIPTAVVATTITSGAMAYLGMQASARLAQKPWFPRSQVLRGMIVFIASLVLIVH